MEAAREVIIQVDAFNALGQEATTQVRLVYVMSLDTGKIDPSARPSETYVSIQGRSIDPSSRPVHTSTNPLTFPSTTQGWKTEDRPALHDIYGVKKNGNGVAAAEQLAA